MGTEFTNLIHEKVPALASSGITAQGVVQRFFDWLDDVEEALENAVPQAAGGPSTGRRAKQQDKVKQAKKVFDKSKNTRIRAWGPTFTGLAIVPALPYLFDHPVEKVTDRAFEWIEERLIERNAAQRDTETSSKPT